MRRIRTCSRHCESWCLHRSPAGLQSLPGFRFSEQRNTIAFKKYSAVKKLCVHQMEPQAPFFWPKFTIDKRGLSVVMAGWPASGHDLYYFICIIFYVLHMIQYKQIRGFPSSHPWGCGGTPHSPIWRPLCGRFMAHWP